MSQNGTIARETPSSPLAERYSVFTRRQKNCIIGFAALGGWFSSVSSFVYFPAIPFLASDLHVSIQKVNLTVTAYLIMSGIFPTLMGNAADRLGRRPVFLAALAVYLGANIGLALQSHFAVLFVLRMLQSAGISGTFSIAYGVLGDLLTPAERGGYSGVMAFLWVTRSFPVSLSAEHKRLQSQYTAQPRTGHKWLTLVTLDVALHLLVSRSHFINLPDVDGRLPPRDRTNHRGKRQHHGQWRQSSVFSVAHSKGSAAQSGRWVFE